MTTFRIIPAQRMERAQTGTRWGFVIENHPNGTPTGYDGPLSRDEAYKETGQWLRKGDFIASWPTYEEAFAAAHALGMNETVVQAIGTYVPKEEENGKETN